MSYLAGKDDAYMQGYEKAVSDIQHLLTRIIPIIGTLNYDYIKNIMDEKFKQ